MVKHFGALDKTVIKNFLEAHRQYSIHASAASERMNYILRYCFDYVGATLNWWDFDGYTEGDFIGAIGDNTVSFTGEWRHGERTKFIDTFGKENSLENDIPTRWLFEDFEQEFRNGVQQYKDRQSSLKALKTAKKNKKIEEKQALVASAKAKLTKEELQALKGL